MNVCGVCDVYVWCVHVCGVCGLTPPLPKGARKVVGGSAGNLPVIQETWVQSLSREDPLEEEMATHSSILAWRIPRTEEPDRLQSMGMLLHQVPFIIQLSPPLLLPLPRPLPVFLASCAFHAAALPMRGHPCQHCRLHQGCRGSIFQHWHLSHPLPAACTKAVANAVIRSVSAAAAVLSAEGPLFIF